MREQRDPPERDDEEIAALLRAVDHPTPPVSARQIVARAEAEAGDARRMRRAAVALLALGLAGTAWAIPGSPLRGWLGSAAGWITGRAPAPQPAPPPDSAAAFAGIAVPPGERLVIDFASPRSSGQVRVSLTDGAEVIVRAPNGTAAFRYELDRVVVDSDGSPVQYEIEIPRTAPRVEIRVAGARAWLKEGARISTDPSPMDFVTLR